MQFGRFALGVLALVILATPSSAQLPRMDPAMLNLPPLSITREALRLEILSTKAKLDKCGGPPACPERALLQARLNQLLKMGVILVVDPFFVEKPRVMPTDKTDYESEQSFLWPSVRQENNAYVVSEARAKYTIIAHCKAMKDLYYLSSVLTSEELKGLMGGPGSTKTKADVNACIKEYDAKEIPVNRKAALEYCLQSNNYHIDQFAGPRFDTCMNTHDMMQAMCKQELELKEAYARRKYPGQGRASQTCPGVHPSPGQIQRILSAPARTMAELPPKFFAPPDVVIPVLRLPIPAGTVLETKLQGALYAVGVESKIAITARLDQPLVVSGQMVLPAYTPIYLKTRVIGPGARPDSVQIGLTTESVLMPDRNHIDLNSDELVFTVTKQPTALEGGGIPAETKLRFTVRSDSTASSPAPAAALAATPPAQPPPVPPTAGAPPPAAAPPATPESRPPDRQQQAEERRKKAERFVACQQTAIKDHPRGGVELVQAITACAQVK